MPARKAVVIAPASEALAVGWEERFIDRPQGRLRYVVAGRGRPLLLCHGFIGSAENFETWVPLLARRRQLLIPDLAGFGGSTGLGKPHTSRALAVEVLALADHLGLESFDLGGLCLGAAVALELLTVAPERVGELILHSPFLDRTMLRSNFRWQVLVFTAPGIFDLISVIAQQRVAADFYRRLVVDGSAEIDRRSADVNFQNQLRAQPRAARQWLKDGVKLKFTRLLADWGGRTLVLAASDDRILNVPQLGRFCAARPNIEFASIAAAGHGWSQDFIDRQLEVLDRFLAAGSQQPEG